MAALMRHETSLSGLKVVIKWAQVAWMGKKYSPPINRKPNLDGIPNPGPTFDSSPENLSTKGFLRPYKEYTPSSTVEEDISRISEEVLGTSSKDTRLDDPEQRFQFLHACWKCTDHPVPNSLLHLVETVGDAIQFYQTPVSTITPLEAMQHKKLPPNLHIIQQYTRYDHNPSNMFGGESAFPESSTLISNLKAQKKYKNLQAKPPIQNWMRLANWPYPPPKQ